MGKTLQKTTPTSTRATDPISAAPGAMSSILLSSVLAALVSRVLLGEQLALSLSEYTLKTPLLELPLYLLLGSMCGLVAFAFQQCSNTSTSLFNGQIGPDFVRDTFTSIPDIFKPVLGGCICGVVGLLFPQILFFGYETLNGLLKNNSLPTDTLLTLLVVKMFTTAVSVGSGLVGGTFAPSLFFGAMVGASFHNLIAGIFETINANPQFSTLVGPILDLADVPAYAMVGAASVLAALFRAPLTASLLLFELTRDYDVILPLMASAGVGSLVSDIIENKMKVLAQQKISLSLERDLSDSSKP
jgi:H+/Cl- antiporter ClcA